MICNITFHKGIKVILHLCNFTAGVWGRYAGEDTRPMYHSLDLGVVANSQHACCQCATHMLQMCNSVCKKKAGTEMSPQFFFVYCYLRTINTFSDCTENGSRFAIALLVAQTTSTLAVMMLLFCNDCKR